MQSFLAEYDFPLCDGDCKIITDAATVKAMFFPKASAVDMYIQPGAGRGLTLHTNATARLSSNG